MIFNFYFYTVFAISKNALLLQGEEKKPHLSVGKLENILIGQVHQERVDT